MDLKVENSVIWGSGNSSKYPCKEVERNKILWTDEANESTKSEKIEKSFNWIFEMKN